MADTDLDNFFAIAPLGLEPVVAAELTELGIPSRTVPGGVEFSGDARVLYSANLNLRTATRVLVRMSGFRARTFFELERHAKKIPWAKFVRPNAAVALRVTSKKSALYHEGAIAERLMKSLEAQVRGVRKLTAHSDDEEHEPETAQLFVIRFMRDECVVSADASGALLHMRGYRQAIAKAPLRETLAASLLLAPRWNASSPLIDPMCGSGTIPIEAALIARRIAPGLADVSRMPRAYAFEDWPIFEKTVWTDVVERARGQILPAALVKIVGSDRDAGAIAAANANAARAGVQDDVAFEKHAVSDADVPGSNAWLVTNPPYGVRVGSGDQRNLYAAIGRLVKESMPGGRVVLLTPDDGVPRHSGLPLQPLLETRNGGIAVRLLATPQR